MGTPTQDEQVDEELPPHTHVEAVVVMVAAVVPVVGAALEREVRAQVDLCHTLTMQGP